KGMAPQRIVLAQELPRAEMPQLMNIAREYGITLAKLPKRSDIKSPTGPAELRPIAIAELLGRAPRRANLGRREALLAGRRVLITGAGGTIGSEICRQVAAFAPSEIILVEACEYNLYAIDQE